MAALLMPRLCGQMAKSYMARSGEPYRAMTMTLLIKIYSVFACQGRQYGFGWPVKVP